MSNNIKKKTLPEVHLEQISVSDRVENFKYSGGDLGNGRYKNFVIYGDYADPDVIRVGDDYYAISSTFHFNPGITVLHSKDLVNWKLIGHVVDDLSKLHPSFSFQRMNGYGAGIWAPAIRFHDNKYWVYVGGPNLGLIYSTAEKPEGPWSAPKRLKFNSPWQGTKLIDCCPFWDEDGKAYFVAAEPKWYNDYTVPDYKVHLFEMSSDGERLLDDGVVIHGGRITEALKFYKKDGYYYILYTEHPYDEASRRTQFAARSKNIYGPYERKKLIHSHDPKRDMCPSQGGLVETPDGKWYFLCHGMYNENESIGRPLMLLPVNWEDGWPIIGEDMDGDGVTEMVWEAEKPIQGYEPMLPQTSDDFEESKLSPQWQWNHAPRNDRWSLTENPGSLRLKASKPAYPGGFWSACNTLTQRIMGDKSVATTMVDLKGMEDGQYAGLCLMAKISHLVGVYMENGIKYIRYHNAKRIELNNPLERQEQFDGYYIEDLCLLDSDKVWFKVEIEDNYGTLLYSLDGNDFHLASEKFEFIYYAWRGGRIGLFSWNEFKDDGHVDFQWFKYDVI